MNKETPKPISQHQSEGQAAGVSAPLEGEVLEATHESASQNASSQRTRETPNSAPQGFQALVTVPETDSIPHINPAVAYLKTLHPGASQENVESKLNCVARWAGSPDLYHCNWAGIRYEHILAFIVDMQKEDPDTGLPRLSSRSINCYLSALKGVAKQAFLLRQMDHEALARIKLIRSIRYSRLGAGRSLSEDESKELLNSQGDTVRGIRDHAILCLLLGCGLRRAEVAGLLLKNVNRSEASVTLIGKGEKERKVFLIPAVADALYAWLQVRGTEGQFVFGRVYKNGRLDTAAPMTPHAVGDLVREYQLKAGLEHLSTHDLRRTFATRLLDAQVDITTVQHMMGHASIATTALYDKRGEYAQRAASKKIKL